MQVSAQSASVSRLLLDRAGVKSHDFARLHYLPSGSATPTTYGSTAIAEIDEVHARRKAVERALELYAFIKNDALRVKLNSALLAEAKEMRFGSGRNLRDWFTDIGNVLGRMRRACGQCRPLAGGGETCQHAEALERAATLKLIKKSAGQLADVCDRQLGSATTRQRMPKAVIRKTEANRANARAAFAKASEERNSLIRRALYDEALDLFVICCGDQLAHCLGEDV